MNQLEGAERPDRAARRPNWRTSGRRVLIVRARACRGPFIMLDGAELRVGRATSLPDWARREWARSFIGGKSKFKTQVGCRRDASRQPAAASRQSAVGSRPPIGQIARWLAAALMVPSGRNARVSLLKWTCPGPENSPRAVCAVFFHERRRRRRRQKYEPRRWMDH